MYIKTYRQFLNEELIIQPEVTKIQVPGISNLTVEQLGLDFVITSTNGKKFPVSIEHLKEIATSSTDSLNQPNKIKDFYQHALIALQTVEIQKKIETLIELDHANILNLTKNTFLSNFDVDLAMYGATEDDIVAIKDMYDHMLLNNNTAGVTEKALEIFRIYLNTSLEYICGLIFTYLKFMGKEFYIAKSTQGNSGEGEGDTNQIIFKESKIY